MTEAEQLIDAIRNCVDVPIQVLPAVVKSVNVSKSTCIVTIDETDYEDVLLQAVTGKKGFIISPKKGSTVLVARVHNSSRLFIAMVSEVDKFTLANTSQNFGKLFGQLIDELVSAIITTPAGAGALAPATVQKLTQIKTNFNQLFDAS